MEINTLAHLLFTVCCSVFLFFFGFLCLKKKELVFLVLLSFAIKSLLIYALFQFPSLFDGSFFIDSKAYQAATARTSRYFLIDDTFPSSNVYGIWETQVSYVYTLIVSPFYLLFRSASTGFMLNAFFYALSLVTMYRLFSGKQGSRQLDWCFALLLFWPSMFFNSLLFIRDGLIVLFILVFLFCYQRKYLPLTWLFMALCIFLEVQIRWYVGLSMVLFLVGSFIISIGKKRKWLFYMLSVVFLIFIVFLINYLGFSLDTIQGFRNILTGLEGDYNANSVYLKGFVIDSYPKLFLFIPLSIFYFLFSPFLPVGGATMLLAWVENIVLMTMAFYALIPGSKSKGYHFTPILRDALLFAIPLLLVYSFGVADSGTAMRQKGFLLLIIVFAFFKKREWILRKSV